MVSGYSKASSPEGVREKMVSAGYPKANAPEGVPKVRIPKVRIPKGQGSPDTQRPCVGLRSWLHEHALDRFYDAVEEIAVQEGADHVTDLLELSFDDFEAKLGLKNLQQRKFEKAMEDLEMMKKFEDRMACLRPHTGGSSSSLAPEETPGFRVASYGEPRQATPRKTDRVASNGEPGQASPRKKQAGGADLELEQKKKKMFPRALFICGAANFSYFFDYYVAITATQAAQTQLCGGDMAVAARYGSMFMSISSAIGVILVPLVGGSIERFGRKPALFLGPLLTTVGRLSLLNYPSWATYGLNTILGFTGMAMIGQGAETTFTDLASGPALARALSTYRSTTGIAMVVSSALGAAVFRQFGAKKTHLTGAAATFLASLLVLMFYRETKHLNPKSAVQERKGFKNPLAFLGLFRDATLAKLTMISGLQNICDFTMEFDGIFLRSDVGLDPSQMGLYYSLRGGSYIVGAAFARLVQGRLGPFGYTHTVQLIVFIYLMLKANAKSFQQVLVLLGVYMLAPLFIRSTSVISMFYDRGLELGYTRESLVAAQTNFSDWLRILAPFAYTRVFNTTSKHGNLYYFCAGLVAFAQLLLMTVNKAKVVSALPLAKRKACTGN